MKEEENTEIFDVIIAGGGPSGLFCAQTASCGKKRVLLLEKNSSCGKKLLITGLSQCNLTQDGDIKNFFVHYGDNGKFLKPALMNFTNKDLIQYFNEKGLETTVEKGSKVFPKSKKASDVLEILVTQCQECGAVIRCSEKILSASNLSERIPDECRFSVRTEQALYFCKNLVVATGGLTYPVTGSTGDGYVVAKSLGHSISETGPALCAVTIADYDFSSLSGISFESAKISLFRENKKLREGSGDILFTHKGLSGPGILHMSRYIKEGDILKISFLKGLTPESIKSEISRMAGLDGRRTVLSYLRECGLYERFAKKILERCEISPDLTCAHLPKDKKTLLSNEICGHEFLVSSPAGVNEAMVTRGGVLLSEVNQKSMESKICPGLYFTGEVLDIDGDTGGYNLQAAFSTGYLAAKNIVICDGGNNSSE